MKHVLTLAAVAALCGASVPAAAATYVYQSLTFGSDGSASKSTQKIPAGAFTAYYGFTLGSRVSLDVQFNSLTTPQYNNISNGSLTVYSGGSCSTSGCTGGSLIGTSANTFVPTVVDFGDSFVGTRLPGFYYAELTGTGTTSVGKPYSTVTTSVFTSAVPEAATWAMMLVGFGGMGAMLRRSRRDQVSFGI